ncbi:MAG: hypothetical protein UY41_C0013G0025 [Candidatus Moranbacteria bacterium GW2011_GWE1_49_15]|nr:MAG: hypothetical protein UX75_C0007G0008 [Candidatus Moranbacteria bacterium GW2011_GWE2_47_10]KKW06860.1 MAG: hypothetical protein UY41_C0013G0025 [Candidatus Moranbacteria bacterium GW2011_GWE1_49_15]HBP01344.1 hypothetical protein [Candidatus Moranbacteria bacterium]
MTFNFETTESADLVQVATNIAMQVYNSTFFDFVKFFLIVYTLVLLADVVLLLMLKGIGSDIRKGLRGMDMPVVSKGKMEKRWEKVKDRLKTDSVSQYKVAILEADSIADEILGKIGHQGANMTERLEQLKPGQLDYQEELMGAHQIRNKIVHDESFVVDRKLAEETVGVYEKFLRYLEFM